MPACDSSTRSPGLHTLYFDRSSAPARRFDALRLRHDALRACRRGEPETRLPAAVFLGKSALIALAPPNAPVPSPSHGTSDPFIAGKDLRPAIMLRAPCPVCQSSAMRLPIAVPRAIGLPSSSFPTHTPQNSGSSERGCCDLGRSFILTRTGSSDAHQSRIALCDGSKRSSGEGLRLPGQSGGPAPGHDRC